MKAIQQRVRRERGLNLALAHWAVGLLRKDTRSPFAPDVLEELQATNRAWRQIVAGERAEAKRRRGERVRRIKRRFGSTRAVHHARRDHDLALKALDGVFEQRESILYQIGDACAWAVLGGQTRLLIPLFNKGKRNALPTGVGLGGPVHVASSAHATGNFLVVHNDLTRCICTGDLTVVWAKRPWRHPAVFEVKTTEPDEHGQSTISLLGNEGGWPVDLELLRDFHSQLGFAVAEPEPLGERAEKQWQEITSRAELMQDISASGLKPLSAEGRTLWKGIERVLQAALRTGYTYDQVEPGVYMIAVRNGETGEFEVNFEAALTRLRDDIFWRTPKMRWGSAGTSQLSTDTAGAPLVAPILLWRISPALAAHLVANELVLIGYVREDVWPTVFAHRGIARQIDEEGKWLLRRGAGLVTFNPVEVAKITAGVIFSGISPIAVADAVDADLTAQANRPEGSDS